MPTGKAPHSRVMLHQPSVGVQGTASDIAISAREILRLRKKANELFARETPRAWSASRRTCTGTTG